MIVVPLTLLRSHGRDWVALDELLLWLEKRLPAEELDQLRLVPHEMDAAMREHP